MNSWGNHWLKRASVTRPGVAVWPQKKRYSELSRGADGGLQIFAAEWAGHA